MRNGVWQVVGASVQGTSHADAGSSCQDAHLWRVLPGGELILVIADGAGSAAHAAEGAQEAVRTACEALAAGLWCLPPRAGEAGWRELMAGAYRQAHDRLACLARKERRTQREYATTLTCALVTGPWLITAQLGDGFVVAETAEGELFLAAHPQRGEYANEAYFLTMDNALAAVEVNVRQQEVNALAASTDGLLRLALRLPGSEPHTPFFRPLLAFAAEAGSDRAAEKKLLHFLDSKQICARTDDDKTLVVASRRLSAQAPDQNAGRLLLTAPPHEDGRTPC